MQQLSLELAKHFIQEGKYEETIVHGGGDVGKIKYFYFHSSLKCVFKKQHWFQTSQDIPVRPWGQEIMPNSLKSNRSQLSASFH